MFKLEFLFCCCLCICSVHLDAFKHAWPVKGTLYIVRAKNLRPPWRMILPEHSWDHLTSPSSEVLHCTHLKECYRLALLNLTVIAWCAPLSFFPPKFLGSVSECALRRVYSMNNSCQKLVCTHVFESCVLTVDTDTEGKLGAMQVFRLYLLSCHLAIRYNVTGQLPHYIALAQWNINENQFTIRVHAVAFAKLQFFNCEIFLWLILKSTQAQGACSFSVAFPVSILCHGLQDLLCIAAVAARSRRSCLGSHGYSFFWVLHHFQLAIKTVLSFLFEYTSIFASDMPSLWMLRKACTFQV